MTAPRLRMPSDLEWREKLFLLLAALCLLSMPQTYQGGAAIPHPHAIFQFWIPGGHLTAEHHHDSENMASESQRDPMMANTLGSTTSSTATSSADPTIPTISQVSQSAERMDAIGTVLVPWLTMFFLTTVGVLYWLFDTWHGRKPAPETPPPRYSFLPA